MSPSTTVEVGKNVTIKATAEKGSGSYQYQFYVVNNGQEQVIRPYGNSGTYTWTPKTAAVYTIGVKVKDSSGTVVKKEIEEYTVAVSYTHLDVYKRQRFCFTAA